MSRFFESPIDVELAFYDAVERADLEAMQSVWAGARNPVCVHPAGEPLRGLRSILQSWEAIFQRGPEMHFRVEVLDKTLTDDIAVHIVAEYIRLIGEPDERSPVFSTNIYRCCEHGWQMVLHHASPTPERRRGTRQPVH